MGKKLTLQVQLIANCSRGTGGDFGDKGGDNCNDNAATAKVTATVKMRMMVVRGVTTTVMRGGEQGQ